MKVLLINPPFTQYGSKVEIQADEPLGLMSLAAYVRSFGAKVKILDAFRGRESVLDKDGFYRSGISEEEIKGEIKRFSPDIVGIAAMFTMHSKGGHDVAAIVKGISPGIPVVMGGSHASSLPEAVLSDRNIDIAVIGEGEQTFLEVIRVYERKESALGIAGTAVREGGGIKINRERPFIKDISELPMPSRDLVDMQIYLNDKYRNMLAMQTPRANMITSRGCPYQCPYCSIHSIWRHSWRGLSAEKIIEEIRFLVKTYGVREIAFQDDNLTLDRKRMEAICDGIIKSKLGIKWCTPNGVAIWTLDEKLLDRMKISGCYKLTFGIETGCLKTQEFIKKTHLNLVKADKIIRYCNKIGLWTHSAFIVGFPYETRQDIEETIRYAVESDLDLAAFFIATPFPGTELYDIYKKEGLLSSDLGDAKAIRWTGCQQKPMSDTRYFRRQELEEILKEAHRRFYRSRINKFLNPLRLLRKFTGFAEIHYFIKLARMYNSAVGQLTQ